MAITVNFNPPPSTTLSAHLLSQNLILATANPPTQDDETLAHAVLPELVARPSSSSDTKDAGTTTHVHLVRGRLPHPVTRFGVTIVSGEDSPRGTHAVLRVFSAPTEHGSHHHSLHLLHTRAFGGPGCDASIDLASPSPTDPPIAAFEIEGRPGEFNRLDVVRMTLAATPSFEVASGAQVPASPPSRNASRPGTSAGPLQMHAASQDTLRTTLRVTRSGGSRGEILLSMVAPAPGVTWSFDPPTLVDGADQSDLTLVSGEFATPGKYDIQVVAVPRTPKAGTGERLLTIPLHVLAARPNGDGVDRKGGRELDACEF